MPTTRARSRARAEACGLLELPDELLLYIGEFAFSDLPSALRLQQTCKRWRQILAPVQQKAVARRLRWNDAAGVHLVGSHTKRSVIGASNNTSWYAAVNLLPQTGVSKFCLRITRACDGTGYHRVGICDGDDTFGWGFNPCTGSLMREQRDSDQRDVSDDESDDDTSAFPGHHREHLWFDSDGEQLASRDDDADPTGVEVHIEYRPEAGLVTFRVGDGPPVTLSGFGAPLRLKPWAFLMYEEDNVAFEQPYIEYSEEDDYFDLV